jgi:acyl-CoA thioesterase I
MFPSFDQSSRLANLVNFLQKGVYILWGLITPSIFRVFLVALFLHFSVPTYAANAPVWLIMGDSLSAEYGLKRGSGWVALLDEKLKASKKTVSIQNASISGETTSGGKTRLPALLTKHKPSIVVIELGGNDALRGLDASNTEANLAAMIKASRTAGAKVMLIGMKLPPNFGKTYGQQFENIYTRLAEQNSADKIALLPFFLEGFGEDFTLFQADRIHPKEAAQPKMLANVWPILERLANSK